MAGLRGVTLRQLQIFCSAARHSSFSRASKELHLTQPGVSMQMRQLEDSAGLPLFERTGKGLHLTDAGRELLRHAQQALAALRDAEDSLDALKGLKGGRLTIAAVSTAKYYAPKLLALFSGQHPGVELKLSVNNREAVVQQLAANEIDLAIMGTPPKRLDTIAEPFARHPLVVIAAPGHPLAGRKRIPLKALEKETFLVREPGSGTRSAMERFFGEREIQPRIGMEMSSNETIKQAVMAGLGVSFISQHTIGLEVATGQLTVLKVEGLPVVRQWNVVHLREKRMSPAAEAFKAFILDHGSSFLKLWPQGPAANADLAPVQKAT
jgi:LysR family transcriptional regulator, low CO2-responsive transcriptional regulator